MTMLLVLIPVSVITFTIGKSINAMPLTLAFDILAFVDIAVFKNSLSFAIGPATFHLTGINRAVFKRI